LSIIELAVKCGKTLAQDDEAWIFALDAMINVKENKTANDDYLKSELDKASQEFIDVKRVKQSQTRLTDFGAWNNDLEKAFQIYQNSKPYINIKKLIEENLNKNKEALVFHEANSCPEFWENTRLATGLNVAIPMLKGAQSLIDR
jgi:hypothetical protein